MTLTAEEMLAGSALTHDVEIPDDLLTADGSGSHHVVLKPLTVSDLQRILKAAGSDDSLSAAFIIQHGLREPELSLDEISRLPAGIARFLVERINAVSGIDAPRHALDELVQAPLARACFVLAKEFGWTPEEVSGLTIGQILLYLQMAANGKKTA
jgi:hypothetical protein